LFEDLESFPTDCSNTGDQSCSLLSSDPESLSQPVPSSNCGSQNSDITSTTIINSNGQPWELEQAAELDRCNAFVENTCGCKWGNGKPCSLLFTKEYYTTFRSQASFLTREQLDLVLLGSVMSTTSDGDVVAGRHKPAKRQRTALTYMHKGHQLCRVTFNFLHGIGKHRVPAIKKNFIENGLETRTHGNTKTRPHNALTWDMVTNIVKFINNYAEQNAILLPGRIPGYKRDDIKLLPSSDSKKVRI